MLSLQILSFHNNPPASLPPIPLYNKPSTLISHLLVHTDDAFKKRWSHPSSFSSCIVHAVEKDSQHFEVDPDKAREALQKLDQQLQSLSQKQIKPPKIRGTIYLSLSLTIIVLWASNVRDKSFFTNFLLNVDMICCNQSNIIFNYTH